MHACIGTYLVVYAKHQLCFVYMLANTELWLENALPLVVGLSSYAHAHLYSIFFYSIFRLCIYYFTHTLLLALLTGAQLYTPCSKQLRLFLKILFSF